MHRGTATGYKSGYISTKWEEAGSFAKACLLGLTVAANQVLRFLDRKWGQSANPPWRLNVSRIVSTACYLIYRQYPVGVLPLRNE